MQSSSRVLAIHDLSGFGHTSLLEVIPVLYRMGLEAAVLPTVLLSANTDHPDYRKQDTDAFMQDAIGHWLELGVSFDAIFSGFLGNPGQASLLTNAIPKLKKPQAPVLVDPVMGDDGRLYGCYDCQMVSAMRELISISDIITPNLTEAALLLDRTYPDAGVEIDLRDWGRKLAELGTQTVIITSVPGAKLGETNVYCYHRPSDEGREFCCSYVPVEYPGTGDCFSTLVLGGIMNGFSIWESVQASVAFLRDAIAASVPLVSDRRTGIALARVLGTNPLTYLTGEKDN